MNVKGKSTLEKFEKILNLRNYAENSITTYKHYVEEFIESFDKPALHITSKEVKIYIENYKYSSVSQQNQIYSALKLFAKHILEIKLTNKIILERPRSVKKLPRVINHDYILECIDKIGNLKHKCIVALAYSTGMRVSEITNLELRDVDSKQMLILIRDSKFNKDRYVKLTPFILSLLRLYYQQFRPKVYLFNGQSKPKYTPGSCNKIVKRHLGEDYHMHKIRHSYATRSMENGTDKRLLQNQMGHNSSKTLEQYTHVSREFIQKSKSPI